MAVLDWFKKAMDQLAPPDEKTGNEASENDKIQGGMTGYSPGALRMRQAMSPMHGPELEAFEWVMAKMEKQHPDMTYGEQVSEACDSGYFYCGDSGELRVSRELPK